MFDNFLHFILNTRHFLREIDVEVVVNKLYILAGCKGIVICSDTVFAIERDRLAVFGHIFIQTSVSTLPSKIQVTNFFYLLTGEHRLFLLFILVKHIFFGVIVPTAQIDKQHLVRSVTQQSAVQLVCLFVII